MRQIAISLFKQTGAVLFALCFVLNTNAWAGKIFNWNNDVGHTHFTDYRSSIPLKYRNQIKDEVEPPKFNKPESTMQSKLSIETPAEDTPEETEKEGEGPQGEGAEEKKEGGLKMEKDLAKLLVGAINTLLGDYYAYNRFIKAAKFDKEEGRYFVILTRQSEERKKAMLPKLEKADHPTLVEVRNFLFDSLEADKEVQHGKGPNYIRMLEDLESRLEQEQQIKQDLAKKLQEELKSVGVTNEMAEKELGSNFFNFDSKE